MMRRTMWIAAPTLLVGIAMGTDALACGCFARPSPDVDILQAGEYVVFAEQDGKITMQVQISYSGPAERFAWLLPVPAVPELSTGTDELFRELLRVTTPSFRVTTVGAENCLNQSGGRVLDGGVAVGNRDAAANPATPPIEVSRSEVGPYEATVVRADDLAELTEWLRDNELFVADANGEALAPYVRPGAFFLALKLRSDKTDGDIQPIVLEFDAAMPMIPVSLTRVGATPDMPVFVWVLGESRAIPRNYRHTVLNLEHIEWMRGGFNYQSVVTRAVDEAEGHHAFVTEFAGSTSVSRRALFDGVRFGTRATLESITDAADFAVDLRRRNFPWRSQMIAILRDTFVYPAGLEGSVTEEQFYGVLDFYLTTYRMQFPEQFEGVDFTFDPVALTERLWTEIVEPIERAQRLIDGSVYMTRMFTTLSPDEMTLDPAFAFNPDLPDVSNVHRAVVQLTCAGTGTIELPDGRVLRTNQIGSGANPTAPFSHRIEILTEEGPPQVEVDNEDTWTPTMPPSALDIDGDLADVGDLTCGCTEAGTAGGGLGWMVVLVFWVLRRRR